MSDSNPIDNQQSPRTLKLNNTNYRHNLESDYTEKIETLAKSFDYASNSEHLWGDPELSIIWNVSRGVSIMARKMFMPRASRLRGTS